MSMKRCPICGEKYSDTYKYCPFCEEEEAQQDGEQFRRRSSRGRRSARREPNLLSPVLIFVILAMLATLTYLLFGNAIADKLGLGQAASSSSGSVSTQEPVVGDTSGDTSGTTGGDVTIPSSGDDTQTAPDTAVSVSKEDFTLSVGESYSIKASGGSENYTWDSEDPGIASVSGTGKVTAISAGTTNVTVSDGYTTAVCIVRIKGIAPGTTAVTGNPVLSKSDVTVGVGESFKLTVSGTASSVTWATENSGIAAVTDGTVKAVSRGVANITAQVDGKTLTCIVRVR